MPIHGYPGNVITANPTAPTVSSASGVWTTEQQLINQSAGRWPMAATQISRSLRFNSADSAYLNRTPASTSNQRTFTQSLWTKKPVNGAQSFVFSAQSGSGDSGIFILYFASGDSLVVSGGNTVWRNTTAVYRDPSAWYHIVLSVDTTQATANNRIRLYVNGSEVTAFATTNNPTQNFDFPVNSSAAAHYFGRYSAAYSNQYLTEVNFIDGLALDPSYFGFNDSNTGVWTPKQYTGAYGTNGFYVNFSDNSNTTAATLGKDYSGNGNNWTPNNFSVTAGAGNDSLVDSPTSYGTDTGVGGSVRGNYATLNAVRPSTATLSEGNLKLTATTAAAWANRLSTIGMREGKWYCEFKIDLANSPFFIGIADESTLPTQYIGQSSGSWGYYGSGGTVWNNASSSALGASYTTGDLIGIAFNADSGQLTFYKNGVSQGTVSSIPSGQYFFAFSGTSVSTAGTANFGQRAFDYTAPSGFKALCTQNLPTPTIGATSTTQANDYFNAVLYTGTGSSQGITGVGFQPDWVWIKERSGAADHGLYDAVRGVQKQIESNRNDTSESTQTTGLTAFNSDGFTVGSLAQLNTNTDTYVAWNWKANGAGGSNTAGTISSTVSANTTSGFSVVTYTGNGSSGATIGHGLGVTPSMIMIRVRNSDQFSWGVYHASVGNTAGLYLNLTNAAATTSVFWNNTSPTSSVFSVGNWGGVNGNTSTYVAYCFAPVAGYSAFGSYTGNGAADGPFVYLGFRPRYLLLKVSSTTSSWFVYDSARDTYNIVSYSLNPNLSDAEGNTGVLDFVSNGFKLRNSGASFNVNGNTVIYAAFAEFPFKTALAR